MDHCSFKIFQTEASQILSPTRALPPPLGSRIRQIPPATVPLAYCYVPTLRSLLD